MKTKDARVVGEHEVTLPGENIFEAIGFPEGEAAELMMRAQLLDALTRWRRESGITQMEAAKRLQVSQARISDIERGKIHIFSLDTLVRYAQRAGLKPELKLAA